MVKTLLDTYASATGLKTNYSKLWLIPSNVAVDVASYLANVLGCVKLEPCHSPILASPWAQRNQP